MNRGEGSIRETDLLFLRGIVDSPIIDKITQSVRNPESANAQPLTTDLRLVRIPLFLVTFDSVF